MSDTNNTNAAETTSKIKPVAAAPKIGSSARAPKAEKKVEVPVEITLDSIRRYVLSKDEDKVLERVNRVLEQEAEKRQAAKGWWETLRTDKCEAVKVGKLSKLIKHLEDLPDEADSAVRKMERKFLSQPAFFSEVVGKFAHPALPKYLAKVGKLPREVVEPHAEALAAMVEGEDDWAKTVREDVVAVLCNGRKVVGGELPSLFKDLGVLIGEGIQKAQQTASSQVGRPGPVGFLGQIFQAVAEGAKSASQQKAA